MEDENEAGYSKSIELVPNFYGSGSQNFEDVNVHLSQSQTVVPRLDKQHPVSILKQTKNLKGG